MEKGRREERGGREGEQQMKYQDFRCLVETTQGLRFLQNIIQFLNTCLHSWMCDRGRLQNVLSWLHTQHEDEMEVTPANAFLCRVPLIVLPSAESRGYGSTLGGVPVRSCLTSSPAHGVLSG